MKQQLSVSLSSVFPRRISAASAPSAPPPAGSKNTAGTAPSKRQKVNPSWLREGVSLQSELAQGGCVAPAPLHPVNSLLAFLAGSGGLAGLSCLFSCSPVSATGQKLGS